MDRSALVATWSVSLALLLFVLAWLVVLLSVSVFLWSAVVEAGTVKSMVSVAEAPEASVPTVQVLLEKLPTLGVAVPRSEERRVGKESDTLRASEGQQMWMVMV